MMRKTAGGRRVRLALVAWGLSGCGGEGSGGRGEVRDAFVALEVLQGVPSDCPLVALGQGRIVGALSSADGIQLFVSRCVAFEDPALCPTEVVQLSPGGAPQAQLVTPGLDLIVASHDRPEQLVGVSRIDRRFYRVRSQDGAPPSSQPLPIEPVAGGPQVTHVAEDADGVWAVLNERIGSDFSRLELWRWPLEGDEVQRLELMLARNAQVTGLSRALRDGSRIVGRSWVESEYEGQSRYLDQAALYDSQLRSVAPPGEAQWQSPLPVLGASVLKPDGLWVFGRWDGGYAARFRLTSDYSPTDLLTLPPLERCTGCDSQSDGFQNDTLYAAAIAKADGSWILGGESTGMQAF